MKPSRGSAKVIVPLVIVCLLLVAGWLIFGRSSSGGPTLTLPAIIAPQEEPLQLTGIGATLRPNTVMYLSLESKGIGSQVDRFITRVRELSLFKRQGGEALFNATMAQMKSQAAATGVFTEAEIDEALALLGAWITNPSLSEFIISDPETWKPGQSGELEKVTLPALYFSMKSGDLAPRAMKLLGQLLDKNLVPLTGELHSVKRDPSGTKIAGVFGDGAEVLVPASLGLSGESLQLLVGAKNLEQVAAPAGGETLMSSPTWKSLAKHFAKSEKNIVYFSVRAVARFMKSLEAAAPTEEHRRQINAVTKSIETQLGGFEAVLLNITQGPGDALWSTMKTCSLYQPGSPYPTALRKILAERQNSGRSSTQFHQLIDDRTLLALSFNLDQLDFFFAEIERIMANAKPDDVSQEDQEMVKRTLGEARTTIEGLQIRELGFILQAPDPGPIPLPKGAIIAVTEDVDAKTFFENLRTTGASLVERMTGAPPDASLLPSIESNAEGQATLTLQIQPPFGVFGQSVGKNVIALASSPDLLPALTKQVAAPTSHLTTKVLSEPGKKALQDTQDFSIYLSLRAFGNAVRPFLSMAAAQPDLQALEISAQELSEVIDLLAIDLWSVQRATSADDTTVCAESYSDIL